MFIMSGLSRYLVSSIPDTYSASHPTPIYGMGNSSGELTKQNFTSVNVESTSIEANDMAYSAYLHRAQRSTQANQYSEADCQRASTELASLVSVTDANPSLWHRYKGQIERLQSITKSVDCKAG